MGISERCCLSRSSLVADQEEDIPGSNGALCVYHLRQNCMRALGNIVGTSGVVPTA